MINARWIALAAWLLVLTGAAAQNGSSELGPERITAFDAMLNVRPDGVLEVEETITVVVRGDGFKRGIFRTIPTLLRTELWTRKDAGFRITEVLRDGRPEPYVIEPGFGLLTLRIGREDFMLPHGEHVYTIRYVAPNQLRHRESTDELYWNVTGDEWGFRMDRVTAVVRYPGAAGEPLDVSSYSGPRGTTTTDASAESAAGEVRYVLERGLAPGHGLTVSVSWPTVAVDRPTTLDKIATAFASDPLGTAMVVGGLLLGAYYWMMWNLFGREPRANPLPEPSGPPVHIAPASVRYLRRQGHDNACVTASILNMGAAGCLDIEQTDDEKRPRLRKRDQDPAFEHEAALYDRIFQGEDTRLLGGSSSAAVIEGVQRHAKRLATTHKGTHFVTNRGHFWIGFLLIALGWIAGLVMIAVRLGGVAALIGGLTLFLLVWSFIAAALGAAIHKGFTTRGQRGQAIALSVFGLPFFGVEIALLVGITALNSIILALAMVAVGGVLVAAWRALPRVTPKGRKLLDEIDAYEARLDRLAARRVDDGSEGEVKLEALNRELPYAVALGREREWEKLFEGLAEAAVRDGQDPDDWVRRSIPYYGFTAGLAGGSGSLTDSLSSGLTGSLATSATAASSGSGGGGFSGGGGGGGGGGGW
ncbi:MAG: DUF2207 domain-containing protein [Planctomycetota bacterium]